jgi:hypothetical protein
VFAEGLVAR